MNRMTWIKGREPQKSIEVKVGKYKAEFTRERTIHESYWSIYLGENKVITATIDQIWGDSLTPTRALENATKAYGREVLSRIENKGLSEVRYLLTGK